MPSSSVNIIEGKGVGSIDNYYLKIHFTDGNKDYRNLTIHTPTEAQMKTFLTKLKPVLNKYKISVDLSKLKIGSSRYKDQEFFIECCEWYDMPEYKQNPALLNTKHIVLQIQKGNQTEPFLTDISKILGENINKKTFGWFPERPNKILNPYKGKMWESKGHMPKYPIYILSKGRWERRLTSKYLEWCGIPYKIVVEPQEYEKYAEHIDKSKILILPKKYLGKDQGGIPARNFIMDHARSKSKTGRHWILDDNIGDWKRLNNNERVVVKGGCVFKIVEDYTDRYVDVKMSGHNYTMFGMNPSLDPITKNTRVYSSILLSNDIPDKIGEGWRGKYNEDTDLSLRLLKAGFPTILFNCIMANKETTLTNKGGNEKIYKEKDGLYKKAKSLADQHPDVAKVSERYGRVHHIVDYSSFKNLPLKLKPGLKIPKKINNYGMKLVDKVKNPIP